MWQRSRDANLSSEIIKIAGIKSVGRNESNNVRSELCINCQQYRSVERVCSWKPWQKIHFVYVHTRSFIPWYI